jgi:lysophospholipase L1-like esterase
MRGGTRRQSDTASALAAAILVVAGCSDASSSLEAFGDATRATDGAAGRAPTEGSVPRDGADARADEAKPPDAVADAAVDAERDAYASVEAGAPAVRFIARVDRSDPAGPRFAWSGSTVVARFTGSSVGVRLAGKANFFDVRIDGQLMPTLATAQGREDYPLASNLGPGAHEVSVFRRTEAREGITTFLGFTFDPAGELLPPGPPSERRLEIVGDSTTCGYGVEGKNSNCPFTLATENYDVTYGPVAARAVGAELITVAWSAKGMYRNFAGDMTDTMPILYERTLPDPSSKWDFTSWIPHAVVINLGSNDFQKGDPGQAYVTTYTAFVHHVRENYPDALIICALGPKLSGQQLATARGYVTAMVDTLTSQGDAHIAFLELPQAEPEDGFGCGGHASVATHQRMGETLAGALRSKLGW